MDLDKSLIIKFVKCTERAAYGASLMKGKGDKVKADQFAVDEMRNELNKINMKGRIVIGEGEMDKAPMLYVGEKVGNNLGEELDIAVDPLAGTNFAAKNLPNALSVLAVTKKNNLLNAPETYMEKIAIGSGFPNNLIDLDFSVEKNIKLIAEAKGVKQNMLTACVLKRPRHDKIIRSLNSIGVKINFITDGDVSGVISVSRANFNNDIYIGIGGGPEGVLAAAALKCLNCQMQTRLIFSDDKEIKKAKKIGIENLDRKYNINDMVSGDVNFCASGVTDGAIVKGIKTQDNIFFSETFVLHKSTGTNKILKNSANK